MFDRASVISGFTDRVPRDAEKSQIACDPFLARGQAKCEVTMLAAREHRIRQRDTRAGDQ